MTATQQSKDLPNLTVDKFDTRDTIKLKWAQRLNIIPKYLILNEDDITKQPISISDIVGTYITEGREHDVTDAQSLFAVRSDYPFFNSDDIAYIYRYLMTQSIPAKEIPKVLKDIIVKVNEYRSLLEVHGYKSMVQFDEDYNHWQTRFYRSMSKLTTDIDKINRLHSDLNKYSPKNISPIVIKKGSIKANAFIKKKGGVEDKISPSDGLDIFNSIKLSTNVPFIGYNFSLETRKDPIKLALMKKFSIDGKTIKKEYSSRQQYTKVFTGSFPGEYISYENTIYDPDNKYKTKDIIYMTIYLSDKYEGDKSSLLKAGNKDKKEKDVHGRYVHGLLNLTNSNFRIINRFPTEQKNSIIKYISDSLSSDQLTITFNQLEDVSIEGEFNLYDITFDEITFLEALLNNELFSRYFFLDETTNAYYNKVKMDYRFKPLFNIESSDDVDIMEELEERRNAKIPVTIRFSLEQNYTDDQPRIIRVKSDQVEKIVFPPKTPYITINFSSKFLTNTNAFINIFSHIMTYYLQLKNKLGRIYQPFISNQDFPVPIKKAEGAVPTLIGSGSVAGSSESAPQPFQREITYLPNNAIEVLKGKYGPIGYKLRQLADEAPEIFGRTSGLGYGHSSNDPKKQPIIVTPDEAEIWKKTPFTDKKGVTYSGYQVIEFPPPHPALREKSYLMVCPGSSDSPYYFPSYILNKHNKIEQYPYIPICNLEDHTTELPDLIQDYHRKKGLLEITEETQISPMIGLQYRGKGHIKKDVLANPDGLGEPDNVIKEILSKDAENEIIYRYGVVRSPNSLLHCLYVALHDQNYMRLPYPEREKFIGRVRKTIDTKVHLSICKQELYQYSNGEIKDFLNETSTYMDSIYYYRLIEGIFKINLFIFDTIENKIELEIPNYTSSHIRINKDELPSVILYKQRNIKRDERGYPQYELIIRWSNDKKDYNAFYGIDTTRTLSELIGTRLTTITFTLDRNNVVARQNVGSTIDYETLFKNSGFEIVNQLIDSYGKMRGLIMTIRDLTVTVAVPPTQPINVDSAKSYSSSPIDFALKLFNKSPTAISKNNDGQIIGLWYQIMDIDYGIYIPVIVDAGFVTTELLKLPNLYNPLNDFVEITELTKTNRLNKLQRDIHIILSEILWAYVIANVSVDNFITQYCTINESIYKANTELIYDFSEVGRYFDLTKSNSIQVAMGYLNQINPTLVNDGKNIVAVKPESKESKSSTGKIGGIIGGIKGIKPVSSIKNIGMKSISSSGSSGSSSGSGSTSGAVDVAKSAPANPNLKFQIYNQKLLGGIKYFLSDFTKSTEGLKKRIKPIDVNEIKYLSQHPDFLLHQKHVNIFTNKKDLSNWIMPKADNSIKYKLQKSDASKKEPYLFKDIQTQKIYLIQNVNIANIEDMTININIAINVAFTWYQQKRNLGYYANPYSETQLPDYVIYGISIEQTLKLIEDRSGGRDNVLQLLLYETEEGMTSEYSNINKYAAMLPLV